MTITRRGWIGATAVLAGAAAIDPVRAETAVIAPPIARTPDFPAGAFNIVSPGGRHDYTAVLEALRDYALAELAAYGLPGMTLAITDDEGFSAVLALGWADRERRIPVHPGHYFQIGSISKSFVALTVLALADQGKVDLEAPAARYLPDAPFPAEPVTVAQLLSHTSGLADDPPLFPRVPGERLWCGFAPGSRFSYSNLGYALLGRLIERVSGLSHPAGVDRFVRQPLGLSGMAGVIGQSRRPEFAVGYWPWNRVAAASLPGARLEFASWNEEDTPAGSVGATSGQMAVYLRALLSLGAGRGAPVLSDASARRFSTPVTATDEFGPGARYACGVAVVPVDGAPCLHHTGGMMAFSSSFHADPAAGVACFASVNARNENYRPRLTTAYAVRLMRAARAGSPLPTAPDPLGPFRFKDAAPLAGRFVADNGEFSLIPSGQDLSLSAAGGTFRAVPSGPGRLVTDHPRFARFGLDAVYQEGSVIGYWWGETLFGRGAPRPRSDSPPNLRALAGDYLNRDPWVGGATILARGDTLVAEGQGRLIDRGGWWSVEKDPGGVERLRFDGQLNGKAQRLNISGADLIRVTV